MHTRRIAIRCLTFLLITSIACKAGIEAKRKLVDDGAYAQMLDSDDVYLTTDDAVSKYYDEQVKQTIVSEYNRMRSINSDTVGWIYISDTQINYPIMSGDNNYYLNYTPYRERAFRGSIFLDQNQLEINELSLLHGHNMLNGSMFSHIKKFKEKAFFDSHNILIYDGTNFKVYEPQGIMRVKETATFKYNIQDRKELQAYGEELKSQSFLKSADPVTEDDILLINTCVSDGTGEHHILISQEIARDTLAEEDTSDDTTESTNDNTKE